MKEYPSQEYLNSIFEYHDGGLYRLTNIRNGANGKIGDRVGSTNLKGFREVSINRIRYKEHRIIYIMINGNIPDKMEIDHINRIPYDNRIENLRVVNRSINNHNRNSSNIKHIKNKYGISFRAHVTKNRKMISKTFYTEQEAIEWVAQKKSEIFQDQGLTWMIPVIE